MSIDNKNNDAIYSQDDYKYGFHDDDVKTIYDTGKGLTEEIVRKISAYKHEPEWMTDYRVNAYRIYESLQMPTWGPDLSEIDFQDFTYYKKSGVLATRAFMRGESWSYYRLSGGKATYFLGKFTNLKTQYNNAKFKTISKSTFNKTLKKYTKGKKAVKRIKTYANTKANRKKYLK